MPYIQPTDRTAETAAAPQTAGELNYAVTLLIRDYFQRKGGNYQAANDIVGALEGAKLEFYRRVVGPYEDTKIEANGDVY
jgi:hypothetical protein